MAIIKESWRTLWNTQDSRILVLVSLCLQFGLAFLCPLRKRTARKLLIILLWSFYLAADYVAILALGNFLKRQYEGTCSHHGSEDLRAFWAPFLLLHLGGPDTITSYSIEDNELWWRHFLGLVVQVVVAFIVLLELVAIPRLRVPAAFVFIAGLIKYSERTLALRSSSMDQLRNSMVTPGPNYAKFMEEFTVRRAGQISINEAPLPVQILPYALRNIYDTDQILKAYEFFNGNNPLITDLRLSLNKQKDRQTYFRNHGVCKAFKLVEIELSLLYDVLHTKAISIKGLRGCLWRFISLGIISSAFAFFLKSEKKSYAKADIIISYVLFGAALFMELISLVLILISDWMIVALQKHGILKKLTIVIAKVMSCFFPKGKPRWSNSMGQYSLLNFSLGDKETIIRRILGAVKVKELWDNFIFVHFVRVPNELEKLIFEELKAKSNIRAQPTVNFKELRDCKGEKFLQQEAYNHLTWSVDKEIDESILLWHIATDLCFQTRCAVNDNPETGHGRNENNSQSDRKISLIISNYMVYLLIMQPTMLSDGIGKTRFQDTCAQIKNYIQYNTKELTKEEFIEKLLVLWTNAPIEAQKNSNKNSWSVLLDASRLADDLNRLAEDERWYVISRVWVEMLGYAAINCKPYYHAKQLSQGGELLTHVFMLMAHMCI